MARLRVLRQVAGAAFLAALAGPTAGAARDRWDVARPIPVFVQGASRGAGLVELALAAWGQATDGRIAFARATRPQDAALRVFFVEDTAKFGETTPRVDRGRGRIVAAEVALQADPIGDALGKRIVIYLTALHEIGHALGLPHSPDFDSAMYRFTSSADAARFFLRYRESIHGPEDVGSPAASGLWPRDRAAIQTLYPP